MTKTDSLLADILAHPEDDARRLIYADLIEDRAGPGDVAHAELIRLQVALAQEEPGYVLDWTSSLKVHDGSANPKIRRAIDCCREWWRTQKAPSMLYAGCVWVRGFIEEVKCNCRDWMEACRWLVSGHPIRFVWLWNKTPAWGRELEGDPFYSWFCADKEACWFWSSRIPTEIFQYLPGSTDSVRRDYPNIRTAREALTFATLGYARDGALAPWMGNPAAMEWLTRKPVLLSGRLSAEEDNDA